MSVSFLFVTQERLSPKEKELRNPRLELSPERKESIHTVIGSERREYSFSQVSPYPIAKSEKAEFVEVLRGRTRRLPA